MNLLLLIMNMLLFVNILIPLSTAQQCKNCGKGNVAAKRIKMINKSTFTRIAGVELDNIFQITPEKNMTVCAQRCDANLTCTVFEFNKPHKLCLLSTSYAVIDPDLVSNAFATAIFVKIVGTFKKKLPKGPESCLSKDEYSDYLITNVTQFLKNGTAARNATTTTSSGPSSNLPSTPPSESTSSASAASTPGAEINHGASGGTTSDMETTSTPTDSNAPAESATPSDAVTTEEEKATSASGLSPTASKMPTAQSTETSSTLIRDTTTTQKPSTVSPKMSSSSTYATETTKTTTATSTSSDTTTSSSSVAPSSTTVSSTSTSSSKSSSTSADSTTTEAQKETTDTIDSTTIRETEASTITEEPSTEEPKEGEKTTSKKADGPMTTTTQKKTDDVNAGSTTSTTRAPAGPGMWYDDANRTDNVRCGVSQCSCEKDFELKITVGDTNYTAVFLCRWDDGVWYVQGERGYMVIDTPNTIACVPSERRDNNPNICKAPVIVNGKYTTRGVVCDDGKQFTRALGEGPEETCYDSQVGICTGNTGFKCGTDPLFPLGVYYCETTVSTTTTKKNEEEADKKTTRKPDTNTNEWFEEFQRQNVFCKDKQCKCGDNEELKVLVNTKVLVGKDWIMGTTYLTGLTLNRTMYSNQYHWTVGGQTTSSPVIIDKPIYAECARSWRKFDKPNCWAPVVVNGTYDGDRVSCYGGLKFDHAKSKKGETCRREEVLKCAGGWKCTGFSKGFELTVVYCK